MDPRGLRRGLVDDGSTALVHADCRAQADGDVIEAAALIPDPSAPRTVSPRAVSPPPPNAARTINDATIAARTYLNDATVVTRGAERHQGALRRRLVTVRTLRAAVAKVLGVEEAVVKKVVKQTLMAQIAADSKPTTTSRWRPLPAPAAADADDDWGSATFWDVCGRGSGARAAPRKSRFDAAEDRAGTGSHRRRRAPELRTGARLAARAERFGAKRRRAADGPKNRGGTGRGGVARGRGRVSAPSAPGQQGQVSRRSGREATFTSRPPRRQERLWRAVSNVTRIHERLPHASRTVRPCSSSSAAIRPRRPDAPARFRQHRSPSSASASRCSSTGSSASAER